MKTIKTTFTLSFLILGTMILSAFRPIDKPVNFTGTWLLNMDQSSMGNAPILKSGKSSIKILQQAPSLIMEKSMIDSAGKVHTILDTIAFGKSKTFDVGNGQKIAKTINQQWSADKKVITLASKYTVANEEGEPLEFSGTETWKLSADGKVLTIVNETVLPDRTDMATLVYTKQ